MPENKLIRSVKLELFHVAPLAPSGKLFVDLSRLRDPDDSANLVLTGPGCGD